MTRVSLIALIAVCLFCFRAPPPQVVAAPGDSATSEADQPAAPVDQLIADLGADQFAVRRRAEQQLMHLGPDAYDQLKLAEDHDDLEIAERVRYVLERLRVEWVREHDAPEVRRALARFADLSESDKGKRIARLAEFADGAGLGALCRIARFEPAPRVARRAALEVVERNEQLRKALASAVVDEELGASDREPVEWIRLARTELTTPADVAAPWDRQINAEIDLLAAHSAESDFVSLYRLLRHNLALCRQRSDVNQTVNSLERIINLDPALGSDFQFVAGMLLLLEPTRGQRTDLLLASDIADEGSLRIFYGRSYGPVESFLHAATRDATQGRKIAGLYFALQWALDQRQWKAAEELARRRPSDLEAHRSLLYYLAAAQERSGNAALAKETALRAFELRGDDDRDVSTAKLSADLGLVDSAIREYRRVIDENKKPTLVAKEARDDLAMWLHDREQHQEAAEVLGEFINQLGDDLAARRRLMRQLDEGRRGESTIAALRAQRDYYQACHHQAHQEYDQQRELLEKAANASKENPDILIAMYRLEDADEEFRQQTLDRIEKLSREQYALIDQYADDHPYKATCYNQWAWLISNTTGDYAKAVEYSRKSLELAPGEPSYLDTLGRCYYAAGDLENAVKYQRQAVELTPHFGVMQRQLAQFEKALADKQR